MKLLLTILLFFSLPVFAQQPSYFSFANKEFEGVDIYDVIQDKEFNYWFASDQGIYKHDGYSFKKIECDEMKSTSVFNFVMDSKGVIYCCNLNFQVFKIENDVCSLFIDLPRNGKKSNVQITITADDKLLVYSVYAYLYSKSGKMLSNTERIKGNYLSTAFQLKNKDYIIHESGNDQVILLSKGKFQKKKLKLIPNTSNQAIQSLVFFNLDNHSFAIDKFSKIVYNFDEKNFTLNYKTRFPAYLHTAFLRFYSVKNELWLASSVSGVSVFDKDFKAKYANGNIYPDFFISNVYQDHENNVLVSTFDKGVLVIPELKVSDVIPELSSFTVNRIASDGEGTMFFGGSKGQIISYKDGKIKEITKSGSKVIEMLNIWKDKGILFFDDQGICTYDTKSQKKVFYKTGSMKDIYPINDTSIMIGFNVGVYRFDYSEKEKKFSMKELKKFEGRTNALIYEAKSSYLYVATNEGLKFQSKDGEVSYLTYKGKNIYVTDFSQMGDLILATTHKNGILFIRKGKIVKQIFPKVSNEQLEIFKFQYVNGLIYANTSLGLAIINLKGDVVQLLNKAIGISTNKIIDFYVGKKYIWIAHGRGVQKIDLKYINNQKSRPQLIIAKIFSNDKQIPVDLKKANLFKAKEKKIKFILKVPTLKSRENLQYHYKLLGNDPNWISLAYEQNEITYNALEPGTYTFLVKAENNSVFSETLAYRFTILTPFYQKWWFIVLVILFGFAIISLIYKRQLKIQEKKARQINELNASKLTAIQSQMNPHFIFNSLNSIQDLVLKGDVDNSYTFITKFSNLVRRTLNYSDKDFIDFEQEVKLLELYLSLEKLRFREDLEYEINTNNIEDILVPPMLIQPFIENALLHGLLHKEGPKTLSIQFRLEKMLYCEITDNGVGRKRSREIKERQGSEHESFAVHAIKKRFEIFGNSLKEDVGFEYVDLFENDVAVGTKVILRIPFKKKF